ncbi:MAG TPA: hypothetical protein VJ969_02980, partial [Desulfopila sp.]|nr:hypothetical protein [Desulfopila sp.]
KDPENIDPLFSGQTYVVKKNADLETCERIRRSFFAIGAVCYIKDPKPQDPSVKDNGGENTQQIIKSSVSSSPSLGTDKSQRKWKAFLAWLSTLPNTSRQSFNGTKEKTVGFCQHASESIQSDFEIDGIKALVKNGYFLLLLFSSLCLLFALSWAVTYERKTMPMTASNLEALAEHIAFIENAFTTEELRTMTQNRRDFLDYVLVDYIHKKGYEFEVTVEAMARQYLRDKFNDDQRKIAKIYLEFASHERQELVQHAIISTEAGKILGDVAAKLKKDKKAFSAGKD